MMIHQNEASTVIRVAPSWGGTSGVLWRQSFAGSLRGREDGRYNLTRGPEDGREPVNVSRSENDHESHGGAFCCTVGYTRGGIQSRSKFSRK